MIYADPGNPHSWNLYSYGLNSPLLYSDPDGHEPCVDGVNPENGNLCAVATAKAPKVEPQASNHGVSLLSSTVSLVVATSQVVQQTNDLIQPYRDWFSGPRKPICTAGYTALGATAGFWAGGGLGSLGVAGGPAAALTIPGGAAGGGALGGAVGGFAGMILCNGGGGGGSSSGGGGAAGSSGGGGAGDLKRLTRSEIKKLKAAGEDAEQIKKEIVGTGGSKYDLFKTGSGDIVVKLKSGAGEAQPTGLNIRNF